MRTMLWTVFLVVALQGMASASTAFASPTDMKSSAQTRSVPSSDVATARLDALGVQPPLAVGNERTPIQTQPQVLSKNFSSPKPVQIYWFFGGR
jgi:hypothetical protein